MVKYVLLFRHGSVERDPFILDKDQKLTQEGIKDGYEVAKALFDTLANQPGTRQIKIGCIWHSPSYHVKQDVGILLKTFEENGFRFSQSQVGEKPEMSPEQFWPAKGSDATNEFRNNIRDLHLDENNALLIVGHQPQLGWIADVLLDSPLPISRSEIVCLAKDSKFISLTRRWRLLWTIAPSDIQTLVELREKIKSKMDVAKTLGSFILAIIAIALNSLLDPKRIDALTEKTVGSPYPLVSVYLATASFFLASVLYLATIYAYDRLLMPPRFWAEVERKGGRTWLVERPPSSNVWVLYQNMMRVWNWMFTPATYCVLFGLVAIGYAVFKPKPLLYFIIAIVALTVICILYYRHFRPTLGTED